MANDPVRTLFDEMIRLAPEARRAAFEHARAHDPEVADEVDSLLRYHDAEQSILDRMPAADVPVDCAALGVAQLHPQSVSGWVIEGLLRNGKTFQDYRARREADGRMAELKLVRPELINHTILENFLPGRFAWAVDPQVASLLEIGIDRSGIAPLPFAAFELIEDPTIDVFAGGACRTMMDRARLVASACEAVASGHAQGVLHTALSPKNICVHADTAKSDHTVQVKILDFGLSRLTENVTALQGTKVDRPSAIFSPARSRIRSLSAYAAPEQFSGTQSVLDERTDVFALGAIAFELMTGRAPMVGHSAMKNGPESLACVLSRAMANDRDSRFASVAELARALVVAADDQPRDAQRGWFGRLFNKR